MARLIIQDQRIVEHISGGIGMSRSAGSVNVEVTVNDPDSLSELHGALRELDAAAWEVRAVIQERIDVVSSQGRAKKKEA